SRRFRDSRNRITNAAAPNASRSWRLADKPAAAIRSMGSAAGRAATGVGPPDRGKAADPAEADPVPGARVDPVAPPASAPAAWVGAAPACPVASVGVELL